ERLLIGEGAPPTNRERLAAAVTAAVDHIPFYIHHVVNNLATGGHEYTTESVAEVVEAAMVDPQDTWHLSHYQRRIPFYYSGKQLEIVECVLDVAGVEGPVSFANLAAAAAKTGEAFSPTL